MSYAGCVGDASIKLVDLATFDAEFAAEAVANALRARGIGAQVLGGQMAGFRAEVPGGARVVVMRKDLLRARLALEELRHDMGQIDWESVRWQHVSDDDAPNPADMERPTPRKQTVRRLRLAREGGADNGAAPSERAAGGARAVDVSGIVLRAARPLLVAVIIAGLVTGGLVLVRAPGRVAVLAGLGVLLMTVLVRVFVYVLRPRGR